MGRLPGLRTAAMIACATCLVVSLAAQIQRPNVPLGNDLVYVADLSKTGQSGSESELFMAADVGFITENVYLFCASEGLATVVRGSVDRTTLAKIMNLRPSQKIMLAQTVGYPKK